MPTPPPAGDLFETFFSLSLTGGILFSPLVDAAGEVVDFAYVRLNPAAQRMLALPECPAESFLTRFPHAQPTGIFAFYRAAYLAGEAQHGEFNYQHDGLDNYFYLAARRVEEQLLVSFTDTSDQPRTAVEQALRASQVREQQALAEARHRQLQLRQVFENAPMPLALFRGERYVVELANPALAALWGRPLAQVVGRPVFEALPDLRDQGFEEILAGVLRTEEPFLAQEVPAVLDREHLGLPALGYFNISYEALRGAPGQPATGIIASAIDVTEQVESRRRIEELAAEAETARAEAERQRGELERVFEQAPVAIAVYRGPRYVIQLANPTVARLWGRTQEQLIGKGLFEALPEVAGMGFEELLDGVMATGVPHVAHAMEAKHERDGRLDTVYWDFVYVPTYAADGHIDGAMVVATEVTEQVQARHQVEQLNEQLETRVRERTRQLSEQQALLRQILGQVPASIATLSGPDHHFTFFNELYQELSANRVALNLTVAEVFPEVAAQGFIELLDQVYATGEPFVGTDMPIQLYDTQLGSNRQYYVDFIYQPLFDGQRRVQGILAFVLDVTDRALARQQVAQSQQQVQGLNEELAAINEELLASNEELNDSNRRLTRTNVDLDTFVYTASHDLKAPITNIEGLLDALRDYLPADHPEPMVPRLLAMMDGAVARFLQTIGHLADVTRLQNAAPEPAQAVVLAALVEDVRLDLAPLLEVTRGQLMLDLAQCPVVYFSPKNLRSIFYNLLSNAFKYRHPDRDPVVQVRASCLAEALVLEVQDNGLGLSETQQDKLFVLFKRLHSHVEGTGVGLYMLRRIVENAGGTIAVQSREGVGSTFTVRLPRTSAVA